MTLVIFSNSFILWKLFCRLQWSQSHGLIIEEVQEGERRGDTTNVANTEMKWAKTSQTDFLYTSGRIEDISVSTVRRKW